MIQNKRYPGTKPFTREQEPIFHGREKEIVQLHQLVSLEPLSVLHGKSGLGKSSLINAGLIPLLGKNSYNCPLSIRFQAWTEGSTASPLDKIIANLQQQEIQTKALDRLMPAENSLWYFAKAQQMTRPKAATQRLVLLFDQFEELFSYPTEEIAVFKQQLAELLLPKLPERFEQILDIASQFGQEPLSAEEEDRLYDSLDIRILFSIRSDRMHLLDQLSDFLPSVLKNNYELQALSEAGAQQALLLPAAMAGDFTSDAFEYTEEASDKIIQFLKDDKTSRIEAIQLQILCASFEEKVITENIHRFEAHNIGNLTDIIANYYHHQLEKIPTQHRASAAKLIEEGLLDKKRQQRLTLHESQIADLYQVSPDMLSQLVNYSLLRREPDRREGYTYELSHDTFIQPALAAREKREIKEAKAKAIQQAEELAAERKKRRRAYLLSILAGLLALVSIIALFWALNERNKAEAAQIQAVVAENAAQEASSTSDSLLIISNENLEAAEIARKAAAKAQVFADQQRDEALLQKARAEAQAAKGQLLENTLASDQDAYDYLLKEGQVLLEKGDFRNALTYWANARFLKQNATIDGLIVLAQKAAYAELLFQEGDLVAAQNAFEALLDTKKIDDQSIKKRLTQIKSSQAVWDKAIAGRLLNEIDSIYLEGNISTIPVEAGRCIGLKKLIIAHNREDELFLTALPKTLTHFSFNDIGFSVLPDLLFEQKKLLELVINSAGRLLGISEKLGNLSSIASLYIGNNRALRNLPVSISELSSLTSLVIYGNDALVSLPVSIGELSALTSLKIRYNAALTSLPVSIGELNALTSLVISNSAALVSLPTSIGELSALTSLDIWSNDAIVSLPSIGELSVLTSLVIGRNAALVSIPTSIGELSALTSLVIHGNAALTSLPVSIGKLSALTSLDISSNYFLTSLPASIGELSALTSLKISDNDALTSLPASIGELSALTSLSIRSNDALTSLPVSFGKLNSLTSIDIALNRVLTNLPASFGELSALTSFDISSNYSLTSLPASFGELNALTSLEISGNYSLTSLPASFGELSALTSLVISDNEALTSLPTSFGELSALTSLVISGNDALTNLPASFGELSALTSLVISDNEALTSFPSSIGDLSVLTSLEISYNATLTILPPSIGELQKLSKLTIGNNNKLTDLPSFLTKLNQLDSLFIVENPKLDNYPQFQGTLKNLKYLKIYTKNTQTKILDAIGTLDSLSYLDIRGREIITLPESIGNLKNLISLDVSYRESLKKLPSSLENLKDHLKELDIRGTAIPPEAKEKWRGLLPNTKIVD